MMKSFKLIAWMLPLVILAGCQARNISEAQRFEASVKRELP